MYLFCKDLNTAKMNILFLSDVIQICLVMDLALYRASPVYQLLKMPLKHPLPLPYNAATPSFMH